MTVRLNTDAEVGLLVIDWEKREVELQGLAGHAAGELSPQQVLKRLESPGRQERYAVMVWPEVDGRVQVELYDAGQFHDCLEEGV